MQYFIDTLCNSMWEVRPRQTLMQITRQSYTAILNGARRLQKPVDGTYWTLNSISEDFCTPSTKMPAKRPIWAVESKNSANDIGTLPKSKHLSTEFIIYLLRNHTYKNKCELRVVLSYLISCQLARTAEITSGTHALILWVKSAAVLIWNQRTHTVYLAR